MIEKNKMPALGISSPDFLPRSQLLTDTSFYSFPALFIVKVNHLSYPPFEEIRVQELDVGIGNDILERHQVFWPYRLVQRIGCFYKPPKGNECTPKMQKNWMKNNEIRLPL